MPKKILIVDDEPSIVAPLQFLMEKNGYQVRVATSGEEALEIVAKYRPDLVLLDVMLPGLSGFDVCRMIRENADLAGTRIILVTALGRRVNVAKGMALGADDYIVKPFANQELVAKVKQLLDTPHETEK
jgi:DNA-binding response OmpR family regulator